MTTLDTPPPASPLEIAAYIVASVIALPTLALIVRAIFFVGSAHQQLTSTAAGVTALTKSLGDFKHEVRDTLQAQETRLTLVEHDVRRLNDNAA